MADIWDGMKDTMLVMIKDSLQNGETETILGLQTLESAVDWIGIVGFESIINVIFDESINAPHEAKKIRELIATDGERLFMLGTIDAEKEKAELLEKGYIPIGRIEDKCDGLKNNIPRIEHLIAEGILGKYSTEGDGEIVTHLLLPKETWGRTIEKIVREGKETQVFGSAIGKILAIAMDIEDPRFQHRGFNSLKPLMLAYWKANQKTGEITIEDFTYHCCSAVSRPGRFFSNMQERMKTKADEIQAIKFRDDGNLLMNKNGMLALNKWRKLALNRLAELEQEQKR